MAITDDRTTLNGTSTQEEAPRVDAPTVASETAEGNGADHKAVIDLSERKAASTAKATGLSPLIKLDELRLSADATTSVGVKKKLVTVPVRKPDRQAFFRVHPDPAWQFETLVLEVKEDRETFLVDKSLWSELPGELVPKLLVTAITRQGAVFLMPVRLPDGTGRVDEWSRSMMVAVKLAMTRWVRLAANMSLGAYDVFEATGDFPEPVWPEEGFNALVQIAFRDHYVTDPNHPIIRRLRGEE